MKRSNIVVSSLSTVVRTLIVSLFLLSCGTGKPMVRCTKWRIDYVPRSMQNRKFIVRQKVCIKYERVRIGDNIDR